jgi:hypothetical protein
MIPDAEVVHSSKRRLRVRIPSKKGDAAYWANLADRFADCKGIEDIEVNPRTASLLFVHETDSAAIIRFAASEGVFLAEGKTPVREHPAIYDGLTDTFNKVDNTIKDFTGNELDLSSLSFLALVGAGVYKIAKGDFSAPAWYTAFWYGFNIFLKSKPNGKGAE